MGNMRFKVGDRVRIKSLEWYNENKDITGDILYENGPRFSRYMKKYCGQTMTIRYVVSDAYRMEEDCLADKTGYCWTDEMIEGLVEEENKNMDEELRKCKSDFKHWVDNYIILPDGYVFKDENGNLIYGKKIILEKNKKSYPKTYEECCAILGYQCNWLMSTAKPGDTNKITENELLFEYLIIQFKKLLICRDAYWSIAGEEMGLGKPWEPDWKNSEERRYCIVNIEGDINLPEKILTKWILKVTNKILVFPTEEMRDAFKENFEEEIEICKELL